MRRLWNDECGAILSAELVLLMTILVIGQIVGLKAIQTALVNELADIAAAFGGLNQSFSYSGVSHLITNGTSTQTAGSQFIDAADVGDMPSQQVTGTPGSIDVTAPNTVSENGL
jgi:hypothetical protein